MQPYQSLSCPQMEVVYVPFVPRLLFPISRGMWKISTVQENFHVPIVLKCSPAKISWLVMCHKHVKKRGKCYHSILHLNFDCIQYLITLNKYKTIELRQTYFVGYNKQTPGICPYCHKQVQNISYHIEDKHIPNPTPCTVCGKVFNSINKMRAHRSYSHKR